MKGNKYGCIFRMGLEEAMEYRFDFVMTLLSMIFPVITSICLWTAVNQNTDSIAISPAAPVYDFSRFDVKTNYNRI